MVAGGRSEEREKKVISYESPVNGKVAEVYDSINTSMNIIPNKILQPFIIRSTLKLTKNTYQKPIQI